MHDQVPKSIHVHVQELTVIVDYPGISCNSCKKF